MVSRMISDDKRREVAARMREVMRDDPRGFLDNMIAYSVLDVMGEGVTVGEVLADLINRPTCEMKGDPWAKYGRCSHCGAFVRRDAVTNCIGVIPVRCCPNCGARVVRGDE